MARAETPVHIGDRTHRVTTALPHSLQELNKKAQEHFGHKGTLKLFHRGRTLITKDQQLAQIQNGDVVVITWDGKKLTPEDVSRMVSTHMRDFVPHKPGGGAPQLFRTVDAPLEPLPFQGISDYTTNYIKHRVCPPKGRKRPSSQASVRTRPNGPPPCSSYTAAYIPHKVRPRTPIRGFPESGNGVVLTPKPFRGESSYARDYVTPRRPRAITPGPGGSRPGEEKQTPDRPFQGVTTYTAEYIEWPLLNPDGSNNRPRSAFDTVHKMPPLEGLSEYQREYLKKEARRRALIHLEPELRDEEGVPVVERR